VAYKSRVIRLAAVAFALFAVVASVRCQFFAASDPTGEYSDCGPVIVLAMPWYFYFPGVLYDLRGGKEPIYPGVAVNVLLVLLVAWVGPVLWRRVQRRGR
jgi:hypothetical protein